MAHGNSRSVAVAAGSADGVARLRAGLESSIDRTVGVRLVNCVLSSAGQFYPSENMCAAVLELDPVAARYPAYLSFFRWCLLQASTKDEFKMWVTKATGCSADSAGSEEYRRLLHSLSDTVQNAEGLDLLTIGKMASSHVGMIDMIRKRASWRRLRVRTAWLLGPTTALFQILCSIVGIVVALWLPIWDPGATLDPYQAFSGYLAVACEIAGFPLFILIIYALKLYGPFGISMVRDPRGVMYCAAAFMLGPPIIMVPVRVHAPVEWIVLGGLIGCMVDSIRRVSDRIRRTSIFLDPKTVTNVHGRLPAELRREYTTWLNPWRIPPLPIREARVFISYSRSSQWACDVVKSLHETVATVRTGVFSDLDIGAGENWRLRLNENLADSTVVLAVVDEITVEREWPAAEIESALRGRRMAGLPEVIAIVPQGMPVPDDESWKWFPVFRELLGRDEQGTPTIEVIEYDETTAMAISFRVYGAAYRSPSIVPSALSWLVEIPWKLASGLLTIWTAGCDIAGHIAILLVVATFFGFDSGKWLLARHWFAPMVLGTSAWAGSACAHTLISRFEPLGHKSFGNMASHRDSSIGLICLLCVWARYLTPEQVLWAVLIAYSSFDAVNEFSKLRA